MKHLFEQMAIYDICEQHTINVNLFYRWQAERRTAAELEEKVRRMRSLPM